MRESGKIIGKISQSVNFSARLYNAKIKGFFVPSQGMYIPSDPSEKIIGESKKKFKNFEKYFFWLSKMNK